MSKKRIENVPSASNSLRAVVERENTGTEGINPENLERLSEHLDGAPEVTLEGYRKSKPAGKDDTEARARLAESGDFDLAVDVLSGMISDDADVDGEADASAIDGADNVEDDADGAEDDVDGEESDSQLYRVKVDGQEVELTLAELKSGYSAAAASHARFREAAEVRKSAEHLRNEARTQAETYAASIQLVQQFLGERIDPSQAQVLQSQMQAALADAAAAREHELTSRVEVESAKLAKALNFDSPESERRIKSEMVQTAVDAYGFTVEELSEVVDSRALVLLHDAMQYRKLQSRSGNAKDALRGTRRISPTLHPGNLNTPKLSKGNKSQQAALKRLSQTGRMDDAAAAFEALID
jgi:hypothetical protein